MTINELEQGLRNLIATQPMVSAGANGEVIAGINSIIDAYRNLNFRIQAYPCQDVMKFSLSNEAAKLENTLSNLALQVMQERGINLMLYVPRANPGFGPTVNQFGMITPGVDPNMMMGQMMYQAGSMPSSTAMMPMGGMMGAAANRPMQAPAYNPMQPQMVGVASAPYPRPSRGSAPTFPGYQNPDKPIHLEPTQTTAQSMKTRSAPQAKIKQVPKANSPVASKQTTKPVEEAPEEQAEIPQAQAPSAAEMLIAGATGGAGGSGGKAQGRDYLMELLKK